GWRLDLAGRVRIAPERPWGFDLAAHLFGRQGTPLLYAFEARTEDGRKSVQATRKVDSFRADDVVTLDLRLEKEIAASSSLSLTFSLDGFNVLDEIAVLQRDTLLNEGTAGWVEELLAPRVWRLGVRLGWR
ncbi:MAG: hypothetical protein R3325_09645, partial [Thermoanaerobaculia bacterium]|nr:hypothetical protein [Thermoanaerobaculia bacterium]